MLVTRPAALWLSRVRRSQRAERRRCCARGGDHAFGDGDASAERPPRARLVTIGNAPTALLELLDLIDAGSPAPAAIVGMPVGLVAAAESKDELVRRMTPYVTVLGTRGGSPLAATVNALLQLAVEDVDG